MNAQNEIAQNLHLKKLCMVIIAIALTVGACLFWHAAPFKIKSIDTGLGLYICMS